MEDVVKIECKAKACKKFFEIELCGIDLAFEEDRTVSFDRSFKCDHCKAETHVSGTTEKMKFTFSMVNEYE
jgi:hypothetical protein